MLVRTQNLDEVATNASPHSTVSLSIKDLNVGPVEKLPTLIELLIGDIKNHKEIKRVLSSEASYESALIINFKVTNKALVLENLPQYFEALRAMLGEFGPDAKQAVEEMKFEFRETEDGVQLAIDLSKTPLFAAYVNVVKEEVQKFASLPIELTARVGTDFDLSKYKTSTEQLLTHRYLVELYSQVFNLSALLGAYRAKNEIKEYVEKKDFHEASFIIGLLSLRNINLEIDMDDKVREKLKSEFNIGENTEIIRELIEKAKETIEGLGVKDFLDAMDFVKSAFKDLKEAGLTDLGVFVKAFNAHLGINIKGHAYEILNFLLDIDTQQ